MKGARGWFVSLVPLAIGFIAAVLMFSALIFCGLGFWHDAHWHNRDFCPRCHTSVEWRGLEPCPYCGERTYIVRVCRWRFGWECKP